MNLRVLATEATTVEVDDHLINLIDLPQSLQHTFFEIVFNWLVMEKPHLNLFARIKLLGALVETNKLLADLLLVIAYPLKLLVSEVVIGPCFFKIVNFCEHWDVDHRIDFDAR